MQKSIIIVENDTEVRDGIEFVLEDTFESEVVAKLSTKEDIEEFYQIQHPDLTLISMDPANQKEIQYAQKFINNHPEALAIALSSSKDQNYHKFVREIGFIGFIDKKNFLQDFKSTLNILNS